MMCKRSHTRRPVRTCRINRWELGGSCRCPQGSKFLLKKARGRRWLKCKPPAPRPSSGRGRGICANKSIFHIGRGIYDITGPAAETQMMGYAAGKQVTKGIHMRLRSRAFIIKSPCNRKRVVFVSVDLAQMYHSVRWGVMLRLRRKFRGLYNYNNVMISAIHTHQGIAGYSFCALFNMTGATTGGFFAPF